MLCPSCLNEMEAFCFSDIELDSCASCGGIWFDREELSDLIFSGALPRQAVVSQVSESNPIAPEGLRRCPRCREFLTTEEHLGAKVGVCESCFGFWFEQGEIISIVKEYARKITRRMKQLKAENPNLDEETTANQINALIKEDYLGKEIKKAGSLISFLQAASAGRSAPSEGCGRERTSTAPSYSSYDESERSREERRIPKSRYERTRETGDLDRHLDDRLFKGFSGNIAKDTVSLVLDGMINYTAKSATSYMERKKADRFRKFIDDEQ